MNLQFIKKQTYKQTKLYLLISEHHWHTRMILACSFIDLTQLN